MGGPTQTIYVETQALYNCASAWRDQAAPDIGVAQQKAADGEGQGYLFGVALLDLEKPHDAFCRDAASVLKKGKEVAGGMGAALERTAHDYEATDAERARLITKQEAGIK